MNQNSFSPVDNTLPPPELDEQEVLSWRKKQPQEFKDIVIKQIEKCREEFSKQIIGQGNFYTKDGNGMWMKVNLLNQREVITRCILQLYDLLLYYFDEEAKDKLNYLNIDIKNSADVYFEKYLEVERDNEYRDVARVTREIQCGKRSNAGIKIMEALDKYKLEKYREMYQELLLLFKRKNDLSGRRTVSIM